jgi:hypothetical protein
MLLKQNKHIRLKRKRVIKKLVFVSLSLIFFVGFLSLVAHNSHLRITNIFVEGNSVVLDREIIDLVQKNINGKYILLFPKNNFFIYPRIKIKKDILDTFKRVYSVNVSTSGLNSILITLKEREPYALWCGQQIIDSRKISDTCYFTDKSGFIFTQAPKMSSSLYFEFYGETENKAENIVGSRFLAEEEFNRIISFKELLGNAGFKASRLFVNNKEKDYEMFFETDEIGNKNKWKIIFNSTQDFEKIFNDLTSAINTKLTESGGEDITKKLDYIDLRFNNNVLFKFNE